MSVQRNSKKSIPYFSRSWLVFSLYTSVVGAARNSGNAVAPTYAGSTDGQDQFEEPSTVGPSFLALAPSTAAESVASSSRGGYTRPLSSKEWLYTGMDGSALEALRGVLEQQAPR